MRGKIVVQRSSPMFEMHPRFEFVERIGLAVDLEHEIFEIIEFHHFAVGSSYFVAAIAQHEQGGANRDLAFTRNVGDVFHHANDHSGSGKAGGGFCSIRLG